MTCVSIHARLFKSITPKWACFLGYLSVCHKTLFYFSLVLMPLTAVHSLWYCGAIIQLGPVVPRKTDSVRSRQSFPCCRPSYFVQRLTIAHQERFHSVLDLLAHVEYHPPIFMLGISASNESSCLKRCYEWFENMQTFASNSEPTAWRNH
jgi:hypothetical protein